MKYVLWLLLLFFTTSGFAIDIKQIRQLYRESVKSEIACKRLLGILKDVQPDEAVLYGYKASGTFLMAKYSINPLSKYNYFKKGKSQLEAAIKKDGENVELRFLRWMIQENIPRFLGYNKHIQSDKSFVLSRYQSTGDQELVQMIASAQKALNIQKK